VIDEKFFCKTFLKLFFAALIFSLANVAQAQQQNADGVWKQIPKSHNRQALYYYRTGVRLYQKAKMKEALVQLDEAVKLDPKCAEFYFRRGDCFLELDKLNDAYSDFTRAIQLDPRHFPAFKRRARLSYERGKFDDALKDYTSAEKAATNLIEKAEIVKLKAKMHSSMKKYELAIADMNQSLALDRTAHGLMLRGNQYFAIKQYKKAVDDYTEAISMKSPKLQDRLFTMRADAYEKMGRFDLAKKDKKSAKSIVDDSWGSVLQDMDKQTKL
jgi:tetratricopeptide (TPR) repeat protein